MSKQKPVLGRHGDCLNCGPSPDELPLAAVLAVGFGAVTVTRNGKLIWQGDDERRTMRWVERKARAAPNFDWRVHFISPMRERLYQRQGGKWVLIQQGMGFA